VTPARRIALALAAVGTAVALLLVPGCSPSPAPSPSTGSAPAAPAPATSVVPSAPSDATTEWVERLPAGASAGDPLPLIVAIHGLGDAPDRFCRLFESYPVRARVACPRGWSAHGRSGWSWFPPRAAGGDQGRDIGASADRLALAIARLARERSAPGAPIVTGFSQGGALSLALAVRHPGKIARAIPIGGWLPPELVPGPDAPRTAPILALHGEADERVPAAPTFELIEALTRRGDPASWRGFPGVGHTVTADVRTALFAEIERALDAGAAP
jgi:phospholipase/carboxylesterase